MQKTLLSYSICIFLFSHDTLCKELFTLDHLEDYLTKDNPYIYGAIGQQYIDTARIQTAQGNFDTRLSTDYDKKDYPVSEGEFSDIALSKPTENGTELIIGYRKAEGVQEYNNIKTGSDGEFRVGLKVPVFSLLNGMNENRYQLDATKINAARSTFDAQNNLRNLYAHIVISYYRLLYSHELVTLESQLLNKAKKRDHFITRRVHSGDLPELAILESKQQMISREQRVHIAQNSYRQALQIFLKYIDLSKDEFDLRYTLPSLQMLKKEKTTVQDLIAKALQSRPDLKALAYKGSKLDLDTAYNSLSQYPTLNLFAYGVHDLNYGEGIKVGFQFTIPLERRAYEGKKSEIQKSISQLEEEKNRLILELKTNLSNLMYSLETINKNIDLNNEETQIADLLEKAENKKYEAGSSDLFQVNQREMGALEVKKKQLEYYLNALIIQQEIKKEMGEFITL